MRRLGREAPSHLVKPPPPPPPRACKSEEHFGPYQVGYFLPTKGMQLEQGAVLMEGT